MRIKHLLTTLAFASVIGLSATGYAHEAAKGPNGGIRVDAGKYRAELVANGTTTVTLFLSDSDDKPVAATGFQANAIFVIDGKSQRFALAPADALKLVGTAPAPVSPGVKGAVQLTAPDGTTAQAKF